MKQSQVLCVKCTNGDLHLILKDSGIRVGAVNAKNRDGAVAIKKIMKEEALKPLYLMREE